MSDKKNTQEIKTEVVETETETLSTLQILANEGLISQAILPHIKELSLLKTAQDYLLTLDQQVRESLGIKAEIDQAEIDKANKTYNDLLAKVESGLIDKDTWESVLQPMAKQARDNRLAELTNNDLNWSTIRDSWDSVTIDLVTRSDSGESGDGNRTGISYNLEFAKSKIWLTGAGKRKHGHAIIVNLEQLPTALQNKTKTEVKKEKENYKTSEIWVMFPESGEIGDITRSNSEGIYKISNLSESAKFDKEKLKWFYIANEKFSPSLFNNSIRKDRVKGSANGWESLSILEGQELANLI